MTMPVIRAPVRVEGVWTYVEFTPASNDDSSITVGARASIAPQNCVEAHLGGLKRLLKQQFEFDLPPDCLDRIGRACPTVSAAPDGPPVMLSCVEQRSWELAYLLCCLAGAEAGNWEEVPYWATGEILPDGGVAATSTELGEKLEDIANRGGNARLLGPWDRSLALPSGIRVGEVHHLQDLRRHEDSPLQQRTTPYFSQTGKPALLAAAGQPPLYETRAPVAEQLARQLSQSEKRLFLVVAPLGWGKSTLIAQACAAYGQPVQAVDLARVTTTQHFFERLFMGRNLRQAEIHALDKGGPESLEAVARHFKRRTLLVFTGGMVNSQLRLSDEVRHQILQLVNAGYRVVIELWDLIDWDAARLPSKWIERWLQKNMPRLDRAEVGSWLAQSGLRQLEDSFEVLDGHPLGIAYTIQKLEEARDEGLRLDENLVLERAVEWTSCEEVSAYVGRLERYIGAEALPGELLQWFALRWPHVLPVDMAQRHSKVVQQLVRTGLLQPETNRAGGLLHLSCVGGLLQSLQRHGCLLHVNALGVLANAERERLGRHLAEIAAITPAVRPFVREHLDHLLDSADERIGPTAEYVAPAAPAALADPPEAATRGERLWQAEQLMRNGATEASLARIRVLLEEAPEDNLLGLAREPVSIRRLSLTLWIALREGTDVSALLPPLDVLVKRLKPETPAGSYFLAGLCLVTASAVRRSGLSLQEAHALLERARGLIDLLPFGDAHNEEARRDLEYRYHRAAHELARDIGRAADALGMLLGIAAEAIARRPGDVRWQRRFVQTLRELTNLVEEDVAIPEFVGTTLLSLPLEPQLLGLYTRLLLRRGRPSAAARTLETLAREHLGRLWAEAANVRDWSEAWDTSPLQAGLLLDLAPAERTAWSVLKRYWSGTGPVIPNGAIVQLTALCFRLAAGGWERFSTSKWSEQLREIRPGEAVNSGLLTADAGAFWLGLLDFHVRSHHLQNRREAGAGSYGPSRLATQVARRVGRIRALFEKALACAPGYREPVLTRLCRFEIAIQQDELRKARSADRPLPASHAGLESALERLEADPASSSVALRHRASIHGYFWRHETARDAAELALARSTTAIDRRDSLLLLVRLLGPRALTPTALESELLGKADRQRLAEVSAELSQLWPERSIYVRMCGALEQPTPAFWADLAADVERQLGAPESYWERVSRAADDRLEEDAAIAELTDTESMVLLGALLRWGSEQTADTAVRQRLLRAAVMCSTGAFLWKRGWGQTEDVSLKFEVACSVALALRDSAEASLFGHTFSPIGSKSRGRTLTWPELVSSWLQAVVDKAVGDFKEHAAIVRQRFLPVHQETITPAEGAGAA